MPKKSKSLDASQWAAAVVALTTQEESKKPNLSKKEKEIAALLGAKRSAKEISAMLGISLDKIKQIKIQLAAESRSRTLT